jgi:hypothetical protein
MASRSASEDENEDEDGYNPPSFLSPLPSTVVQPESDSDEEGEPTAAAQMSLSSSLYALHRPIEARRHRASGREADKQEAVLEEEDGDDEDEWGLNEAQEEEQAGQPQTVSASERKKAKLARKLADIFGFEEPEELIAGVSPSLRPQRRGAGY